MNPLNPLRQALQTLHLPFVVVGSTASTARGVTRATFDVDLVVQIAPVHALRLAAALGSGWYADVDQIRDAIMAGRAFNLIHFASGWKVDVFPARTEFHESELRRATLEPVLLEGETVTCPVSTSEDILLAKLRWFRDGGEVSDRQWYDITGLLRVNTVMDDVYLRHWAADLGVTDLLAKARHAAAQE